MTLVPSSVVDAPTILDISVSTPVTTPPIPTVSEGLEPVIQGPPEPAVGHEEEEELQPLMENVPEVEAQNVPQAVALRRSQRERKSAISSDYEVYNIEEVHMEGDPSSYEEAMRSVHSSKWLKAMKDE